MHYHSPFQRNHVLSLPLFLSRGIPILLMKMATTHETATELVDTACKPDNNTRLKVGPQIITFLDGKGKLDARQADMLVDAMTDWLQSSNFKVGTNHK